MPQSSPVFKDKESAVLLCRKLGAAKKQKSLRFSESFLLPVYSPKRITLHKRIA